MTKSTAVRATPYLQGELDGLCGLYALVNATRLALLPRQLSASESQALFRFLLSKLNADGLLLTAITDGLRAHVVSRLLFHTNSWVRKKLNKNLHFQRPCYHFSTPRIHLIELIAAHIALPNSAAMVVLSTPRYRHWSVVSRVTGASLFLFDSDGATKVSLAHPTRNRVEIDSRELFLLRIEPSD